LTDSLLRIAFKYQLKLRTEILYKNYIKTEQNLLVINLN